MSNFILKWISACCQIVSSKCECYLFIIKTYYFLLSLQDDTLQNVSSTNCSTFELVWSLKMIDGQ